MALSFVACSAGISPREQLRRDYLGSSEVVPLQGELADGRVRYCVKEDHLNDGLTQTDLHLQLSSALLVKKCGDKVHVKSTEIWRQHYRTSTDARGMVRGMLPHYEQIGEWQCATVDPRVVEVRCDAPPGESTPKSKMEAQPPLQPKPGKVVLKWGASEEQIRRECEEKERALLRQHLDRRDRIERTYDERVEAAHRTMAGSTLDWELTVARSEFDWEINRAESDHRWNLQKLQSDCHWSLQTGD